MKNKNLNYTNSFSLPQKCFLGMTSIPKHNIVVFACEDGSLVIYDLDLKQITDEWAIEHPE